MHITKVLFNIILEFEYQTACNVPNLDPYCTTVTVMKFVTLTMN